MKRNKNSVLYLGDTSLDTSASYLAGVMTHFDVGFDYVASDEAADRIAGLSSKRSSPYGYLRPTTG
jgi:hypothetical protein